MHALISVYGLVGAAVVSSVAWFMVPWIVRVVQVRRLARLCRERRTIVLTFDDGPGGSLTPRLADLLRHLGIKASFFPVGRRAILNPDIVGRVVADGHEIGSHTSHHLNAWKTMPLAHCRDMLQGHGQMMGLAERVRLFRPPYGKMSIASLVLANANALTLAWWTVDTRDSLARPRSHEEVLGQLADAGGGVVLLHDHDDYPDPDHEDYVLDLVARIARLAAERGLRFSTLSALLDRLPPEVDADAAPLAVSR
jgi:peptidoglycan-N-acetylglucosamine deacetylase